MATPSPLSLANIDSPRQLAQTLDVDVKALLYVELEDAGSLCSSENCPFPKAKGNDGCCIVHKQVWFPRKVNEGNNDVKLQRGYGLFGPEFLRSNCKSHCACCCGFPSCMSIGYTDSLFAFPTDDFICKRWLEALGNVDSIPDSLLKAIQRDPSNHKLAFWHFHPDHLIKDERTGRYKLKRIIHGLKIKG